MTLKESLCVLINLRGNEIKTGFSVIYLLGHIEIKLKTELGFGPSEQTKEKIIDTKWAGKC